MKVKKIKSTGDIDRSISESLEKHKTIWIATDACMFFWESFSELKAWAFNRQAEVEVKNNGILITKESF